VGRRSGPGRKKVLEGLSCHSKGGWGLFKGGRGHFEERKGNGFTSDYAAVDGKTSGWAFSGGGRAGVPSW